MRTIEYQYPESQVNQIFLPILQEEGIGIYKFPTGFQKSQRLVRACERLFGFVLPDHDFRWQLANAFVEADEPKISSLNLNNALGAVYLSDSPSKINGGTTTITELNMRQVSRAMQNLKARNLAKNMFDSALASIPLSEKISLQFRTTDRISNDKAVDHKFKITPCPEALYQIRLFYSEQTDDTKEYLARLGFNIHLENGQIIISITNLQGAKNGLSAARSFQDNFSLNPFNFLVGITKMMSQSSSAPIEIIGLKNPKNQESSALYNTVFKKKGIKRKSRKKTFDEENSA